jgi:hypothetical protein
MADPVIQLGTGVVFGISTTSTDWVGTGTAVLLPVEQDFGKTRQSEPHFSPVDGSVIGETFFRKETTQRVRFYPSGQTQADAAAANRLPCEPGDEWQFLDTRDTELAGYWTVTEIGKQYRHADKVYWDVSLRRHGNGIVGTTTKRVSEVVS